METETISISPISVSVSAITVQKEDSSKIAGIQSSISGEILEPPDMEICANWLLLKDGTKFPLYELSLNGDELIRIQYALPVVINPEDCAALQLNGEEIPLT